MYCLNYYINDPTRFTKTSSSCLDNVIYNMLPDDIIAGVHDLVVSDHFSVYIVLKNVHNKWCSQNLIIKMIFGSRNIDLLVNNIRAADWSDVAYLSSD